jgi:PAS domain S-box-containing protein
MRCGERFAQPGVSLPTVFASLDLGVRAPLSVAVDGGKLDAHPLTTGWVIYLSFDHAPAEAGDSATAIPDITAIRRDEQRFTQIFNLSPDCITVTDKATGRYIDVNDAFVTSLGYSRSEAIGHTSLELGIWVDPDDRAAFVAALEAGGGQLRDFETRFGRKDGHLWPARVSVMETDAFGPPCLIVTALDISKQKEDAERIRKAHEFTEMILNAIPDPVFAKDRGHRIVLVNDAFCAFLGLSRETLLGKSSYDSLHGDLAEMLLENDDLVFSSGREMVCDATITDFEDHVRIVQTKKTMADPDTLIGVVRDLTGMKQLKIAKDLAENARQAAEAANRAKSVFLANMSHELRTPLNAILGFSDMLRRATDLSEHHREKLDIINRSGGHLLALINDVLEMSKIEAGRLKLDNAPFDLGGLVRDVTDMMRLRAQEKGLTLLLDQSSSFPRFICGDEARMRQILVNLVSNAVKFTTHGGVALRLSTRGNDPPHLLLEIEDSGIGISDEDQKCLFLPFVQLGRADVKEGTGLGLAITRQFIELMGGAISVQSTPGKGSIFRVDLPVEISESAAVKPRFPEISAQEVCGLAPGQPAFRILIVEDHRDNQLLLLKLMSDLGVEVKLAANGEECLALFSAWHPHFIWMDRRMPVMDGIEATRRIRQLPGGGGVKIVAITASVFQEQRQALMDAGMDDFVRKPYRTEEIHDCLARNLGMKFIYRSANTSAQEALPMAALARLPAGLRETLKTALESLDSERIGAIVQEVVAVDAGLGHVVERLVGAFDYPAILHALAEVHPENKDRGLCG